MCMYVSISYSAQDHFKEKMFYSKYSSFSEGFPESLEKLSLLYITLYKSVGQ